MKMKRMLGVLILLTVGPALGYDPNDPFTEYIQQKREELSDAKDVGMSRFLRNDFLDFEAADMFSQTKNNGYFNYGKLPPIQQNSKYTYVFHYFDDALKELDADKFYRQIFNKELKEGSQLGVRAVFLPYRERYGWASFWLNTKSLTKTNQFDPDAKHIVVFCIENNGSYGTIEWLYKEFGLTPPPTPPPPPPPPTTTTPTPTTTTTTEKPTTTKKTTTTADPNANGSSSGNPTGDPNGGSGAETTTTDSANGDQNGDQNGGTESTETTTDGTTIDPLGDEDVRKRLPSDQEEIEFDAGSLEQFEFEGFLDSSSALRFLLIVSIVLVGFLY